MRVCAHAWLILAVALRTGTLSASDSPIGYIQSVDGLAQIRTARGQARPVEPFAPLRSGDTLAVQRGVVSVCDMRTGASFEVREGKELALPDTVAPENPSAYAQLLAAWRALTEPPTQGKDAVTRGKRRTTWPDEVRFAARVPIHFRWRTHEPAATFDLRRVDPQPQTLAHTERPTNPLPWPDAVPRTPGSYAWAVHDAHGTRLTSGQFTVMSDEQAAAQRRRFAEQAGTALDEQHRARLAELLAARDGYLLD